MSIDQLADLLAEIGGTPRPTLGRPSGEIGIKQATQLLGVSARTLRFYEEDGLLSAGRSVGAHRYYNADQLTRAFVIISLRRLGMAVDVIRPLLVADTRSPGDVASLLREHVTVLEDELAATRSRLDTTMRALARFDGGTVTTLATRRQAAE